MKYLMNIPRRLLAIVFLAACTCTLQAQPYVDILDLGWQQYQPVNYKSIDGAKLRSHQMTGNLFLPLVRKNKDVLIVGGGFSKTDLQYSHPSSDIEGREEFYQLSMPLGGTKRWRSGDESYQKWQTLFLVIPRISSDMKELTAEDLQLGGVVVCTYQKQENLSYKFGLYYNREYFGNFFMPLAGLDWRVGDRLNIFGVLPGSMNIEYRIGKRFYTGLAYRSITTSYRLSTAQNSPYVREGHNFWGHNQLMGFWDWYPMKKIVISTKLGHTSWRNYRLFHRNTKITREHSTTYNPIQDGFFATLTLAYRIRLDN